MPNQHKHIVHDGYLIAFLYFLISAGDIVGMLFATEATPVMVGKLKGALERGGERQACGQLKRARQVRALERCLEQTQPCSLHACLSLIATGFC